MKKFFTAAVAASFMLVAFVPQATAAPEPSIVILDTGVDKAVPGVSDVLVYEACFALAGCKITEGTDAANVNGTKHGTTMALIAKSVNPNVKIIAIRVFQLDSKSDTPMMTTTEATNVLNSSLDWIIKNKEKYNIVSVSASLGGGKYTASTCPATVGAKALRSKISSLAALGVPTMFASGNNSYRSEVNFPACITESVSVSAVNVAPDNSPLIESNSSTDVDFFALGTYYNILGDKRGSRGTSAATAAFSSYWAKNYKGSYQETYDYMRSISKPTKSIYASTNFFVDILK